MTTMGTNQPIHQPNATVDRPKTLKTNQSRVITSSAANRDFGNLALKSSALL